MAVTKGAMTSLPTSQTIFLQTVEEPEHNRINFRDSLKFFQEQLVINGANFPAPLPVCKTGNDTIGRNGSRSNKEQNSDNNGKISKDSDVFEGEIQSVRSCKIAIPTVDTILESVRVLRAIQKSQEERGSSWNLDVTSKSDIDSNFNYSDDWVQVSDINPDEDSNNESNNKRNDEITSTNSQENNETKTQVRPEINGNLDLISENSLPYTIPYSNAVNEICSFWPSNTLVNGKYSDKENAICDSPFSNEKDLSPEPQIHIKDGENFKKDELDKAKTLEQKDDKFDVKLDDKNLPEQIEQSDNFNKDVFRHKDGSEYSTYFENHHVNKSTKICNTPDSLQSVCKDILNYVNENSESEEDSKEILLNGPNSATEMLEIETYADIDTPKHDDFLLNESLWKESCSPNDSSSTKIEHNDSDSGIGTQRSASSLSPNNPSHMQKDSWSDTCSSHYASAECSPYHSLNSVFESSLGLNITPGETKEIEHTEILEDLTSSEWENTQEKPQESIKDAYGEHAEIPVSPVQTDYDKGKNHISDEDPTDTHAGFNDLEHEFHSQNAELDAEISYCSFISNYTIEHPSSNAIEEQLDVTRVSENCDTFAEPKTVNGHETDLCEQTNDTCEAESLKAESLISVNSKEDAVEDDDLRDLGRIQKFTAASCDLISIVESLYTIKENPAYQIIPPADATEEKFEETLSVLSDGAFCKHSEDDYVVIIEDSILHITKDSQVLLSLNMKYGEVSVETKNILKIDNRMGRCVYIRCDFADLVNLKTKIELHCLKHWQTDCLQLVHYPLKCHQNVVIIDLGSCSTRAGILMDQPTLPSLFFPTICATDKRTGTCVYGMEALQPEVRQHSNLSFPVRPSIKITKHTIDIDLLEGLFKKIFNDLKVDPIQYTVQVCLPRNLSIYAQTALVKLLLEGLKVKAVSLTNQALLTLYAHDVSTAVVVDIGDRTDVLPVVDGFIVENGVTKLPHGGQRLIHHMKHGLAEKRISLSNDIDSFVVQYIIENLAYVAEDYNNEIQISSQLPDIVKKTVTLQPASSKNTSCKSITLEEVRFKITEGLFNPDLWGLDSPGIHHLVQKAIQATSVDVRKRIAENIYVSGGVTMLPGFVERLNMEVAKLSKAKIVPKVSASNYRYHCTYIGACKFAKMEVFPQVCINLQEYTQNSASALKKCALYF